MAYDYEYPYYDPSKFNVDWLLKKIKELDETVLGLETYTYEGENKILDLNDLRANSIASFTQNYNVLNSPISNVRRIVTTEGSDTGGMQKLYNLTSMEIYTRNYSVLGETYTWTGWVLSSYKPDTVMNSINVIRQDNIDDIKPNSVTWVLGGQSQSNRPTNYNAFLIDWKSEGATARLQLWIDQGNRSIYMRTFSGTWSEWNKTNYTDFTNFIQYVQAPSNDFNAIPANKWVYLGEPSNAPHDRFIGPALYITNGYLGMQIGIDSVRKDIYYRFSTNGVYGDWAGGYLSTYLLLHRVESSHSNYVVGGSFSSGNFTSDVKYAAVIGIGYPGDNTDTYQLRITSSPTMQIRFRNGTTWGSWINIQQTAREATLTVSSLPIDSAMSKPDNEVLSHNMYTDVLNTTTSSHVNRPGQSFFRHDEGEQSFLESILAYDDLESFDNITSNLEMWDMEVPIEEMVSSLTYFINELSTLAPLTEFTLFSLPPIDVPFFGDDLYTFEWPNGATLLEIDKTLHELASELCFNYVDFQSYKYINNTALLDTYGEELFSKKVYKNQLSKYVASNF